MIEKLKDLYYKLDQYPLIRNYTYLIIPIVSALVSVALLVLVIFPQVLRYIDTFQEIQQMNDRVDLLEAKLAILKQIDSTAYQSNIDLALSALPTDSAIPPAVSQILVLINSNNLKLDDIGVSSSRRNNSKLDNFGLTVEASGPLSNVLKFINSIDNSPRAMLIEGVELSGNNSANIKATVNVTVYYQPLPTSLGTIDRPVSLFSPKDQELLDRIKSNSSSVPQAAPAVDGPKGKSDPFQ